MVAQLSALPTEARQLIEQELVAREFTPVIEYIRERDQLFHPAPGRCAPTAAWHSYSSKGEETSAAWPGAPICSSTSAEGLQFRIPDSGALDKHSRRLLERFL